MRIEKRIAAKITMTIAAMIMAAVFLIPLKTNAGTTTFYAVTSEKNYAKTWDTEKWYLSSTMKSVYKNGLQYKYGFSSYKSDGKVSYSYKTINSFDKNNKLKASKQYRNGKLSQIRKYAYKGNRGSIKIYDAKKNYIGKGATAAGKTKHISRCYDSEGKLTEEYITTFDSRGRTTYSSGKNYENGQISWTEVTSYTDGKAVKSVSTYYKKGIENSKTTTVFSYSGKYIKEKMVYSSANYKYKTVAKYTSDKAGTAIYSWKKEYDSAGKLMNSYTYKYGKYTSGNVKGCVRKEITLLDGKEFARKELTVQRLKRSE